MKKLICRFRIQFFLRPTWADHLLIGGGQAILSRRGCLYAFRRCGLALLAVDPAMEPGAKLFHRFCRQTATVYREEDEAGTLYAIDLRRSAVSVWTGFTILIGAFVRLAGIEITQEQRKEDCDG